jgi:hypothetical protein
LPRDIKNAFTYPPFLVLLGIGVALRIALTALYFPAVMTSYDSFRLARSGGMFDDFWLAAGYPTFLKAVHRLSGQLWVTITIQHLLGLALAVALYLTLQRIVPRWVACIPTAVLLIAGDALYLEHIILSDQFLLIFSTLACCVLLLGLIGELNLRWLALAGVLAGLAMLSRTPGAFLIGALVLIAVVGAGGALGRRLAAGGVVAGGAAAVLGIYVALFSITGGAYLGLTDMSGWFQYARVAHFADCTKFTPPKGTAVLCEKQPESERLGPVGYTSVPDSIGRRHFPLTPDGAKQVGKFARATMAAQPLDYAQAAGTDLFRFLAWPGAGDDSPGAGVPSSTVSFGYRDPVAEAAVESSMSPHYQGVHVKAHHTRALGDYQRIVRLHGPLIALLFILSVAAVVLTRGPVRLATATFGLAAFVLYLAPALTYTYYFRYGMPPGFLMAISGTLASYGLWQRFIDRREPER